MTRAKQLLFEELCARLPYGVKFIREAWNYEWDQEMSIVETLEDIDKDGYIDNTKVYTIEDIKPYLRPMSRMTEEEREYLQTLHDIISDENYGDGFSPAAWNAILLFNNYCHKHHLDNAGLIEKGLALEALKDMY